MIVEGVMTTLESEDKTNMIMFVVTSHSNGPQEISQMFFFTLILSR